MEQVNRIVQGDCLEVMRGLPDNSVDAVVTDPPYGLSFMGAKWDYDVPRVEVWRECLRVLKPGGHLLAFAGTRTQHRMAVRIEDAGFEIRDMIAWVYGSGFPKSLDVSKAIDKAAGAEREVVGPNPRASQQTPKSGTAALGDFAGVGDITAPATPEAQQWEGWGTALKPSLEPITMARKPLEGTVAANVQEWGTGGINVDGCRVATDPAVDDPRLGGAGSWGTGKMAKNVYEGGYSGEAVGSSPLGRWPANIIHDGSDEVVAGFPESNSNAQARHRNVRQDKTQYRVGGDYETTEYGDTGSAARFFYCAKASKSDRDEGLEGFCDVIINIAPSSQEAESWEQEGQLVKLRVDTEQSPPRVIAVSGVRSKSVSEWNTLSSGRTLTVASQLATMFTTKTKISLTTELRILSWCLSSLISDYMEDVSLETEFGGSHVEIVGNGTLQATITSAKTALALGVKSAASKTQLKISVKERRNIHSTVKPTDLCRYLCRLVTPPGGVVLDPFMGSGSTGKAAYLEGFQFIGIEQDPAFVEIARARIAAAVQRSEMMTLEQRVAWLETQVTAQGSKIRKIENQQLSLFTPVSQNATD